MKLEDYQIEIFRLYKYALTYIGVEFEREDVQEALEYCIEGMEEAFQATIAWWKSKQEKIDYPSAALIKALNDQWKPFNWQPNWLLDPRFKSPCQKYWEEAEVYWGKELRNSLIADVVENEKGADYILFRDEKMLKLSTAKVWGWQRVLDYAQGIR